MKAAKDIPTLSEKDKARFLGQIDRLEGKNACWLWTGGKWENGYGRFHVGRTSLGSHRVAFVIFGGTFENGPFVCHGPCNNKLCVNPEHLSAGTPESNMLDKIRDGTISMGASHSESLRGKMPSGDNNPARLHPERLSRGPSHSEIMKKVAARGDKNGSRIHPDKVPRGDTHHFRMHPEAILRGECHGRAKLTESQVLEIRSRCAVGVVNFKRMGDEYGVTGALIRAIDRRKIWKHVE